MSEQHDLLLRNKMYWWYILLKALNESLDSDTIKHIMNEMEKEGVLNE